VTVVIVRGIGDIGSAVGHLLFREGYGVVIHDDPRPATTRRGMAFADAAFDGQGELDGVRAVRTDGVGEIARALERSYVVPVHLGSLGMLLAGLGHQVLIDARVRKRAAPEVQVGLAELTIAMGPALVAGLHAHVVVETSWDALGAVITDGTSLPLAGEPRAIAGHARDRYVYAPVDGVLHTKAGIGDAVRRGEEVARVSDAALLAPLDGILRGLTHDDVPVVAGTKVIEVDPRGRVDEVRGIGERPRRIAEGVLSAMRAWERRLRP
jgi:xanthine dehydrogenase accessory factor